MVPVSHTNGSQILIGDNLVTFLSPHVLFAFYFYLCLAILVPSVILHRWLNVRLKYRLKKVGETKERYIKLSKFQSICHWGASNQTQQHRMCTCSCCNIIHVWRFNVIHITLLSNLDLWNITVTRWRFNLNLSLPTQFFKHLIVIFKGPTEWELCAQ